MAKVCEIDEAVLAEWLKDRPPIIHELCAKCPPGRLYLLKTTGQRVTMQSYSEDGTVTVNVSGEYNLTMYEKNVFGINPDDLEECDLPPSDQPIGTVLTEQADVDAFIDTQIERLHERGERHNSERCRLCLPRQ